MARAKGVLTRKVSRTKATRPATEARRTRASTSEPRLGAYGRKHPERPLTPGHKRILRGQARGTEAMLVASRRTQPLGHGFFIFCIKHILTSGNLVAREGRLWRLREDVAGVSAGEAFRNLDACAHAIISSMESQYQPEETKAA